MFVLLVLLSFAALSHQKPYIDPYELAEELTKSYTSAINMVRVKKLFNPSYTRHSCRGTVETLSLSDIVEKKIHNINIWDGRVSRAVFNSPEDQLELRFDVEDNKIKGRYYRFLAIKEEYKYVLYEEWCKHL